MIRYRITIVSILFSMVGCVNQNQREWHNLHSKIYYFVISENREGNFAFTEKQLQAILGPPDRDTTILDLENSLQRNKSYHDEAIESIWSDYKSCRLNKMEYLNINSPVNWNECDEFLQCRIWIYDESKHFPYPLYKFCPFCADTGFSARIYMVRDQNIICASAQMFWERSVKKN